WIRARVGLARGTGRLREADEVELRVQDLGDQESLVTVQADVRSLRNQLTFAMICCALLVFVSVVVAATGGASGLVLALPAILGAALVRAISAKRLHRIGRGLEGAVDALELLGESRPELGDPLSGAMNGARRIGSRLRLLGEALREGLSKPEK